MVHTWLLQHMGLIHEIKKNGVGTGDFALDVNAKKKLVLLYGDGLSVSNWGHCFMRNAKQLTQAGRKKFIEAILKVYNGHGQQQVYLEVSENYKTIHCFFFTKA